MSIRNQARYTQHAQSEDHYARRGRRRTQQAEPGAEHSGKRQARGRRKARDDDTLRHT